MIPTQVLNRITHALRTLCEIDTRLHEARQLDARFGGEGRYEADAWALWADAAERQAALLADFRQRAASMGIDGEAEILRLGGQVAPALSSEGLAWLADQIARQ